MDTTSYWRSTVPLPRFRRIQEDCRVDVAIIGAGITGITAAYLFKKAGCKVALIERGRVGGFDTGNTTAHLTQVTDVRLHTLVKRLGKPKTRLAWEAGRKAIEQIFSVIHDEEIDCDASRIPAYHYPATRDESEGEQLKEDAALATALGFPAAYITSVPLIHRPGVCYLNQGKFHPLKYLAALLRLIPGKGCHVFENSEAGEITSDPLTVEVSGHKVRASFLVMASHNPLTGTANALSTALFQTKLFLYTTYAVGGRVKSSALAEASFWDTAQPYSYLRFDRHRGFGYAILGGEDHKTGQEAEPRTIYQRLDRRLGQLFPGAAVDTHWSGQVIETADGLPYIGELGERQFIATGFGGNGMTFGTLAGMMAVDEYLDRSNPWKNIFDPHRKESIDVGEYLRENLDYPYYMVREWLGKADGKSLAAVRRDEGKIIQANGSKVAVYRDPRGKISCLSPACTHLKCIVNWNDVEKTWDCPCHGSRFAPTGEVLSGPAETALKVLPRSTGKSSR